MSGNPEEAFGLKVGDRIELIQMGTDDPYPMEPGAIGTVRGFCVTPGFDQIWMDWDNGRGLNLIPGVDTWRKL